MERLYRITVYMDVVANTSRQAEQAVIDLLQSTDLVHPLARAQVEDFEIDIEETERLD